MLRRPRNLLLVAAAGAIVVLTVSALLLRGRHSQLAVTVSGRIVHVSAGTTLDESASIFGLRPGPGDLLDVEGKLLRRGAVPGALLLDGRAAPPGTPLASGDRIAAADGHDRTESLTREIVSTAEGIPGEPQFTLSRRSGSLVVIRGALSRKLVAVQFLPSGDRVTVQRAVALTFDDGPSPRYTPRVLRILRRLHVPATFFVVGYLTEQYPGLVQAEIGAGMSVGNHSYNHPEVPPFDELPRKLVDDEIALGGRSLNLIGARPRLFRPPGGSVSTTVTAAAEALGQRVVLWSVDPADWQPGIRARQIVRRVLQAVRPGSIVILHDGGGDRSATIAALPAIVRGIRHRGLRLVAIAPS